MLELGQPGLFAWALTYGLSIPKNTNLEGHECGVVDEKLETTP